MNNANTYNYDVVIAGGGTAGVGAAYALKDSGKKVLLIEQQERLGGTAVQACVFDWIAGLFPAYLGDVFTFLKNNGKAQGDLANSWLPASFRQGGYKDKLNNALDIAPRDLAEKYRADLNGRVDIWLRHSFADITEMNGGAVSKIKVLDTQAKAEKIVSARFFIDSSADGVLCRANGALQGKDFFVGRDKRSLYNESLAAENPDPNQLNEPSLYFFLSLDGNDDALLDTVTSVYLKDGEVKKPDYINGDGYANEYIVDAAVKGLSYCNPMTGLGLTGYEVVNNDAAAMYEEAKKRVLEYWKYVKLSLKQIGDSSPTWGGWRVNQKRLNYAGSAAPALGVRESCRIACEYMLTQNDLSRNISFKKPEDHIAIGTCPVDIHNATGLDRNAIRAFNQSSLRLYGVPYKCLLPKRFTNVLIACRAFGASQIAASAFRLNKAMAQLGWAAGNAVKYCLGNAKRLRDISGRELQGKDYIDFQYYYDGVRQILDPKYLQ